MIINSDIFKIKSNNIIPQKGYLLTSEPFLTEKHFRRSVILIIEYDESGGMGLVLNKNCNITLNSLIEDLNCQEDIPLFCGGPVSKDKLFYIHKLGNIIPGSVKIAEDLYIDGDFETILSYIRSGNKIEGVIKFFLGYSGWEPQQLKDEIKDNSWVVSNDHKNLDILMNQDDNLWKKSLLNLNSTYHHWINYPLDPSFN